MLLISIKSLVDRSMLACEFPLRLLLFLLSILLLLWLHTQYILMSHNWARCRPSWECIINVSIEPPCIYSVAIISILRSDADPVGHSQKRRERGRVSLKGVRLVEAAVLNNEGADPTAPDVSCNYYYINYLLSESSEQMGKTAAWSMTHLFIATVLALILFKMLIPHFIKTNPSSPFPGLSLPSRLLRDHRAEQLHCTVHAVLSRWFGEGAPGLD